MSEPFSPFGEPMIADLGVEFEFMPVVFWWEFWKWHQTWRDDYLLSRAAELVLARQITTKFRERFPPRGED